jgi:hypothetical protein
LRWGESLRSLRASLAARAWRVRPPTPITTSHSGGDGRRLKRLQGRLLLILSGNDLTTREFVEYTESSSAWRGLLQEPR